MKLIKSIFKTLIILPSLTTICLSVGMAYADYESAKVITILNQTSVLSNGESYTEVKPGVIAVAESLSANVSFNADAGVSGKVKSWSIWLEIHKYTGVTAFPLVSFENYSFSYSYPYNKRPKTVNRTETVMVPKSAFNNLFTTQCNILAQSLRNQGLSNKEIFSVDRSITYQIHANASASYTGVDNLVHFVGGDVDDKTAEITCMKVPASLVVIPDVFQSSKSVTDSSLSIIEQSTIGGACKVNLSTVIQTNLSNTTVKYRFEHTNGNKSDIKTVKTDQTKIAMDAHWYDIPNEPNQAEVGSIRIIGVSHDFESAWKNYTMTCNEGSPNSVALVPKKPVLKDFSLFPMHQVMYNGMICPTKVRVTARLRSEQAFSGLGNITMKSDNHAFATHDVDLEPYITWHHWETFDLKPWNTINSPIGNAGGSNSWQTQPNSGPTTLSQRFELRYSLSVGNKYIVRTPYKTISVQCSTPGVNQHVAPSNNNLRNLGKSKKIQPKQLQLKQPQLKQPLKQKAPLKLQLKSSNIKP